MGFRMHMLAGLFACATLLAAAESAHFITQKITFTNTTEAPTGTQWEWDFGDGAKSNEKEPTHAYTKPGDFKVILTVKAPNVAPIVSAPIAVTVQDVQPRLDLPNGEIFVGQEVALANPAFSADAGLEYEWTLGKAEPIKAHAPKHRFLTSGSQPVKLTVNIPNGESRSVEGMLNILPIEVSAELVTAPEEIKLGKEVEFRNTSAKTPVSLSWQWTFTGPDGNQTSTEKDAKHKFFAEGDYTVILRATLPEVPELPPLEALPVSLTVLPLFEPPVIKSVALATRELGKDGSYIARVLVEATGEYEKLEISIKGLGPLVAQKMEQANADGNHTFEVALPSPVENYNRTPSATNLNVTATIHPKSPSAPPVEQAATLALTLIPQQPGWILYLYLGAGLFLLLILALIGIRAVRSG